MPLPRSIRPPQHSPRSQTATPTAPNTGTVPHAPTFVLADVGNCDGDGLSWLENETACEMAATVLGLTDNSASLVRTGSTWTYGCFLVAESERPLNFNSDPSGVALFSSNRSIRALCGEPAPPASLVPPCVVPSTMDRARVLPTLVSDTPSRPFPLGGAPTSTSADAFELRDGGNCGGAVFIRNIHDCEAAAVALDLLNTVAHVMTVGGGPFGGGVDWPYGCWNYNRGLRWNQYGDTYDVEPTRLQSLCREWPVVAPTNTPTNAPRSRGLYVPPHPRFDGVPA